MVGPGRHRLEERQLVALEALHRPLTCGAVDPPVRLLEPASELLLEVGVVQEGAAVEEVSANEAHGPLDLALGAGPIGAAGPRLEAPVAGKAAELRIHDELAAVKAEVGLHHGPGLVEEEVLRDAPEGRKRALQTLEEGAHVLAAEETDPEEPRVAQDDQEREALAPGAAELGKVDLRLLGRRRLEADHRVRHRPRPHAAHIVPDLGVAAGVAGSLYFLQQPYGGQLGVGIQAGQNDRPVGVQLPDHRGARPVAGRLVQRPVQLSRSRPALDGAPVNPEAGRQGRLRDAPLEVVFE
jgi:hypothetical protein